MREFHHERFEQEHDHGDNRHFDTTRLSPADFLPDGEKRFNPEPARDEAFPLLKAKFDYIRDIMSYQTMPEAQKMMEGFLKAKSASRRKTI